jgi:hypothetical protein
MKTSRSRRAWLSSVLLVSLSLLFLSSSVSHTHATVSALPWTIFTPADNSLPMASNALTNADFETGLPGDADGWSDYGLGYTVDETGGRGGGRALQLVNSVSTQTHGALQVINLNQTEPRPLYFSGWSRAEDVTGSANSDYSIYLDVYYTDGTLSGSVAPAEPALLLSRPRGSPARARKPSDAPAFPI